MNGKIIKDALILFLITVIAGLGLGAVYGLSLIHIQMCIRDSCGGVSYPTTGSDGSGFELCKKLGHTVTELRPSLIGMTTAEEYIPQLQGDVYKRQKFSYGKCQHYKDHDLSAGNRKRKNRRFGDFFRICLQYAEGTAWLFCGNTVSVGRSALFSDVRIS